MSDKTINKVKEWHKSFDVPIKNKPDISDEFINKLRIRLLKEELDELKYALENKNIAEVLDALSDLQYVLDGTYLSLGFWKIKHEAFNEVHRSNMTKLNLNGDPIYREDGKILKSEEFEEPELEPILNRNTT